jgi:putative transposase
MSETLDPVATELDQRQLAEQLLAQAEEQGVELVGPNGLLNQLTKNVLETALDAEMAEHLGYEKHHPAGRGSGNSRNGTRAKTVFTEIGPVEIEVPGTPIAHLSRRSSRSASAACRASRRSCCP